MKEKTLKQIEQNLHTNNQTEVSYQELQHWYDLSSFDITPESDDVFYLSIAIEGEEYWLSIDSEKFGFICDDEIITSETQGNLADWLFNRK